jgi:hypothetical protein
MSLSQEPVLPHWFDAPPVRQATHWPSWRSQNGVFPDCRQSLLLWHAPPAVGVQLHSTQASARPHEV